MDSSVNGLRNSDALAGGIEPLYLQRSASRQRDAEAIARALVDHYEPTELRPVCLCVQMLSPLGLSPDRHDNLGATLHGFVQGFIVGFVAVSLGMIIGLQLSTVQVVGISALTFYNFISPAGISAAQDYAI
jgi:hypothetical protein